MTGQPVPPGRDRAAPERCHPGCTGQPWRCICSAGCALPACAAALSLLKQPAAARVLLCLLARCAAPPDLRLRGGGCAMFWPPPVPGSGLPARLPAHISGSGSAQRAAVPPPCVHCTIFLRVSAHFVHYQSWRAWSARAGKPPVLLSAVAGQLCTTPMCGKPRQRAHADGQPSLSAALPH